MGFCPGRFISRNYTDCNLKQRFVEFGTNISPPEQQTPQALAAFHKAEIEKWWPVIKAANIKAE